MIGLKHYRQRQTRLLAALPENSVVVIPGATLQTRSRDTEYGFRQHSDMWYLTGFNEPNAWLLLSNHSRHAGDYRGLVCQPKDTDAEIWHGRRLGLERAVSELGYDEAYATDTISEVLLQWLADHNNVYFALGEYAFADTLVLDTLALLRQKPKQSQAPTASVDPRPLIHEMRLLKSIDEINAMRCAAAITSHAHCRAMQFAKPGCYEYQLEAEIHHAFAMAGARYPAYSTIVGSGANACVLHYTENSSKITDGSLVLIDAGAEYLGYAADITRTFPVNGKFSREQAALYQLVLDAQLLAIAQLVPGATLPAVTQLVVQLLTEGLCNLGLLADGVQDAMDNQSWRRFFMHGLGHYLGLDVHDVGDYLRNGQPRPLEAGMVITVEPGLYIPDDPDIAPAFRGIGIRIEDDLLITATGNEVLTADVPKTINEIETLMER